MKLDSDLIGTISEIAVGGTLGLFTKKILLPKCTGVEKLIAGVGGCIGAWYVGRKIHDEVSEFCRVSNYKSRWS